MAPRELSNALCWGMTRLMPALFSAVVAGNLGCEPRRPEPLLAPSASEPSPNASILPAPLAAGPPKAPARDAPHVLPTDAGMDSGAPITPVLIREDDTLSPEGELRLAPGVGLEARFRWLDPPPAKSPDANPEAHVRARDKTAFQLALELSALGRLSVSFTSRAYPFPAGVELRAREDRYGHLLLWPNGRTYTPLPPGSLRAVLAEARLDVTPLADPNVPLLGSGNVLGLATQRQAVETSLGRLEMEQTSLPVAGSAGALLCRMLLELIAVSPESTACRSDWVPLRAEYAWTSGAHFGFEVTKLLKRPELGADVLSMPPVGAELRRGELPGTPFVALIEERELGDLRTRAVPATEKPEPAAPKLGLMAVNRSDGPRYVLVDGVPIVWLRPATDWLVTGLKPGRYSVQARDFFGAESTPARSLELPARFLIGEEPERSPH
jgi:hypothetical protein